MRHAGKHWMYGLTLLLAMLPCHAQAAGAAISLRETIEATLQTHSSLKVMQENRVVVEHELDRAKRGYGPRVDVTAGAGGSSLSDVSSRAAGEGKGFYGQSRIGATLSQPIWDGFATRSRVRTAQATVDSMNHRVIDNATTLGLDALIAHADVLRRQRIVELSRLNVKAHEDILGLARDRQSMGADTVADVAKAESRLARAHSSFDDADAALLDAQETYTRLTGLRAYVSLQSVPGPPYFFPDTQAVLQEAQSSNPKMSAYLEDIKAAKGQQELTQSTYYPNFTFESGPNYSARNDKRGTWSTSFDAMGVMRWNVFNSGADVAADKAAAGRVRQTRQGLYAFYDDLVLEVEKTWTALANARKQTGSWTEAERYSLVTRDAYYEQFRMGQRSLLDLLDAENELYNASTQKVTATDNALVAGYRLLALAGVLLPRLDIPTDPLFDNIAAAPPHGREKRP